ncbi:GT-D fold domain-containing glycosyltransferase [Photobacterium sanguinicancri]|uniref:GT-D fold domain-containing glycosyltransferase n=1 Tax=Photobacterium sanguinicancri TaxID=875932 RepID=UPI003D0DE380
MIKKIIKGIIPEKGIVLLKKIKRYYSYLIKSNDVKVSDSDILKLNEYEKLFPNVLSTSQTLDEIINNRVSICRYGDAEFDISNQENSDDTYQLPSSKLTRRLHDILKHGSSPGLLICIPPFNSKTNNIKRFYGSLSFWEWYWLNKFEKLNHLFTKKEYGNSFVTRETVFHENETKDIKKVWESRDVVFVYGAKGRFNTSSNLFDNIKSKHEILIPPVNAFEEYSSILAECEKYDLNSLFMIAAGPTAAVLAFDLWKLGYQALDIGHLPNSHDEYKGLIVSPEDIPLVSQER